MVEIIITNLYEGIVMLTTIALEEYIKKEIDSRLGEVNWNNIYFKKGYKNSIEGTYIYSKISEIYSLFGTKYEKKKKREIDKILEKNHYNDVQL